MTDIELFAGAGGLALGLEQAGFEGVAFVEQDKNACKTLRRNRPAWNVIEGDIHGIDFRLFEGKVDLVSGGFPCQAFSYAGKKKGFEDSRGLLFQEFARAVKEVKPKVFLFENVKGLLNHDNGETFRVIREDLENLGYSLVWRVLNACYYGVGQSRERLVVVGVKAGQKATSADFIFPAPSEKPTTLRDALKDVPPSEGQKYSEKRRKVLELVPPGGCWKNLPPEVIIEYCGKISSGGHTGMARRLSWDEPSPPLLTTPAQKLTERCHPDETRPLTVREYARIQSFPDSWEFDGSIGAKYKQIGNAVPVELARRIGLSLVNLLEKL